MRSAIGSATAVMAAAAIWFAAAPASTNANGAVTTTPASQTANMPAQVMRMRPSTRSRANCPMIVVTGHGHGAPSDGADSSAKARSPTVASPAATQRNRTARGMAPAIARLVANAARRCTP